MARLFEADKLMTKFPMSAHDLGTVDKIPILQRLMGPAPDGGLLQRLALVIAALPGGSG